MRVRNTLKKLVLLIPILLIMPTLSAQIIDVHLHSYSADDYWGQINHPTGIKSPSNADEHLSLTIQQLDSHNIEFAVICGSIESIERYSSADSRFIPGYMDEEKLIPVEKFKTLIQQGKIKIFGEITGVYHGRTLNDPIYDPYLKVCEEYGIPVAYHTGGGPPMTPYRCCPDFRISLGDPLLIEDVLVRYPKLKVYLMHGGEVFFEHAIRMMTMYQNLYIDLGVILWADPSVQDYAIRLLKLAKNANVLDRVMFGSDQMVWPEAINLSLEFLNSLEFLSESEKELILYKNAKRFLKL